MAGYDPANTNHIDYITIASLGNATDFGDTLTSTHAVSLCKSNKVLWQVKFLYQYNI